MNEKEHNMISSIVDQWIERESPAYEKLLVITPDYTRSCPLPGIVRIIQNKLKKRIGQIDYLVALGTHKLLNDSELLKLYGVDDDDLDGDFRGSHFFNHRWDKSETFIKIGTLSSNEISDLSDGHLSEELDIEINKMIYQYEKILVISPVFPHEVVGFSGGVKYFFPGISGGNFVQKFHWLGGVLGSSNIIGTKNTLPRNLIERAAKFLNIDISYMAMVIGQGKTIEDAFLGTRDEVWERAADLSAEVNIVHQPKQFHTVIGLASTIYNEIWTAGKVMYKLERMVAPGGRLIIYAPHIETISYTWGEWIKKVGYHTRDYLLAHPEKLEGVPLGVFAQSCYVKGMGTYVDGVETPRIDVVLCTAIPKEVCKEINLSYIDPDHFDVEGFRNRESEGYLVVDNAGEVLYIPDVELPWKD